MSWSCNLILLERWESLQPPRARNQLSSVPDFEFADDAVLITPSRPTAQLALSTFSSVATSFGLTVNFVKTKFMACGFGLCAEDYQPLAIVNQAVEHVSPFVYLGSLLSPDGRFGAEIDRRLAAASRAFGALDCVFRNKDLSLRTKRLVYSACVLSTLLYGAECWATLKCDEVRLDRFHHQCLRTIAGVMRWDQQLQHISNADLRKR